MQEGFLFRHFDFLLVTGPQYLAHYILVLTRLGVCSDGRLDFPCSDACEVSPRWRLAGSRHWQRFGARCTS